MANLFKTNLTGTGSLMIYELKELLKLAGWTVTQSGDATTYDDDGDVITGPGGGAGGMANTRAWFVARMPGTTRELCFQRGTTDLLWRIKYSWNAGFSGGSPSADTVPSASDEEVLHGSGTDSSPTGAALFHTDSQYYTQIMAQDSGRYGFWLASYDTSRISQTAILLDPMAEGSFPDADADPYAMYVALDTSGSSLSQVWAQSSSNNTTAPYLSNSAGRGPKAWMRPGLSRAGFVGIGACYFEYYAGGSSRSSTVSYATNATSGEDVFLPVVYARAAAETPPNGVKGVSSLMRINSNRRNNADTTADLAYIQMGHVVLPWDGATVPMT